MQISSISSLNVQDLVIRESAVCKPTPTIHMFIILNANHVANGSCRDLHMKQIENLCAFDRSIHQLARMTILGDDRQVEMPEQIANQEYDSITFHNGDEIQTVAAESLTIIGLDDEEYESMVNDFEKSEKSHKSESSSQAQNGTITVQAKYYTQVLAQYFKKEQEIIAHFRLAREEEQARFAEDTRERQTKERDRRWNQKMDYWIEKDKNRRQILSDALTHASLSLMKIAA